MTTRQAPPHDLGAERSVIATVFTDPSQFDEAAALLAPEDFYQPLNADVWRALGDLRRQGDPLDPVTVASRLAKGRQGAISQMVDLVAGDFTANLEAHVRLVSDHARARRLIQACQTVAAEGYSASNMADYLDRSAAQLSAVVDRKSKGKIITLAESLRQTFKSMKEAAERPAGLSGFSTGFRDLDAQTSGMHGGEVWIVAGRPGMGKSAFIGGLVVGMAADTTGPAQCGSLIVSLEMTHDQITQRMTCAEGSVPIKDVRSGRISSEGWSGLTQAAQWLSQQPIAYYDQPASLADIVAMGRRQKNALAATRAADGRPQRLAVVAVDYLQLVNAADARVNREQQVAEVSRGLKRMAKELDVCVIALSQLSRKCEERTDKRPMLSDLRESGQLEQDADVVMFLYRDEYYNESSPDVGLAEAIVAKQRSGPTGTVMLGFDDQVTRFYDQDQRAKADGHASGVYKTSRETAKKTALRLG